MPETTTEEEKEFTISHPDGSTSTIKGKVVTTDHGVTDKDGNPKISSHIALSGQVMPVHVLNGEAEKA
jgi:uncharacterized Rossmann fold enzyme